MPTAVTGLTANGSSKLTANSCSRERTSVACKAEWQICAANERWIVASMPGPRVIAGADRWRNARGGTWNGSWRCRTNNAVRRVKT